MIISQVKGILSNFKNEEILIVKWNRIALIKTENLEILF